jgi:hypothetical protein
VPHVPPVDSPESTGRLIFRTSADSGVNSRGRAVLPQVASTSDGLSSLCSEMLGRDHGDCKTETKRGLCASVVVAEDAKLVQRRAPDWFDPPGRLSDAGQAIADLSGHNGIAHPGPPNGSIFC